MLALSVLAAGCQGYVGDTPTRPGQGRALPEGVVQPAPQSRAPRLTHDQWERTVQDLFGLEEPTGLSDSLRADSLRGDATFDNRGGELEVDEALWSGYQRASATVAEQVVDDATVLDGLAPPGGDPDARAEDFVRELGARAHRRPLSDDEVTEYLNVFASASGLYGDLDDFRAGARLTIEAMLQSPFFLYRIEDSVDEEEGTIPLDDYEVASRLSYTLWGSMPDEELFAAAAADMLSDPEQVEVQARRMLEDPRARDVVVDFHRQLFDVDTFGGISPDPDVYAGVSDRLGELAVQEHDLFVTEIVFHRDGSYRDLLTSSDTHVNDELAAVYGLEGDFGDEMELVSLDPTRRRGIFTQVGFLASNATRRSSDPIHRGVFLAERVACIHIDAPPDDTPAPEVSDGQTTRENIELHTEQPGSVCAGCHAQIINPFGYPFEHFDAVGAWRDTENGVMVDPTASPPIDGAPTPVSDATELAESLADSTWTHECYVRHWIEYALGRASAPEDQALVSELAEASRDESLPVKELLVSIVTSRAFLHRSLREESE
ncbi:MAG TPA: DUF1592 domain-containing protein [Sandaracinaceae bacterium LLY-WYZ-13_1]|nr:DUF1592 domain-containing protein [Sandaracinaceae bacterium LLY-WYZ-13_1]